MRALVGGAVHLVHRLVRVLAGRLLLAEVFALGAASAPADVAGLLEIGAGVPLLRIERVARDVPIESVEAFFHPDRYRHYNELPAPPTEVVG